MHRVLPLSLLLSCEGKPDELSSTPYQPDAKPWYQDADGDGYGNPGATRSGEQQPTGYVDNALDCDDQNIDIHPGAEERCTPGDEDCDGLIDDADPELVPDNTFWADPDGDGLGDPLAPRQACNAPVGFVSNDDDCSPEPVSVDWVDGADNDCDGRVDVQGGTLGSVWASTDPIRRHVQVGDTTLWMTSTDFAFLLVPPPPLEFGATLYALRDVDLSAPQLLFNEVVSLGSLGDLAVRDDMAWIRFDGSLYLLDPTVPGLSPALAFDTVNSFYPFPLAVGDYDGDGEDEVAAGTPLTLYGFSTDVSETSLVPEQSTPFEIWDLANVHLGPGGDSLLVSSNTGMWLLSPGQWDAPTLLYSSPVPFAVGDLDSDGLDDIAMCGNSTIEIWRTLTTDTAVDLSVPEFCYSVAIADATGDGTDDLWVGYPNESVLFAGRLAQLPNIGESDRLFVVGEPSYEVEAGDLDADGYADLGTRGVSGWRWFSGRF